MRNTRIAEKANIIFYHSIDFDGKCSAAIVYNTLKVKEPDTEIILYGINYGQPFPWDLIQQNDAVYMVDFTLQPFDQMIKLKTYCYDREANLIWIEHHEPEIKEAEKIDFFLFGNRRIGISACALVWEYFYGENIPYPVQLLAQYDVWNKTNPDTFPFQYGMRLHKEFDDPDNKLWNNLIFGKESVKYMTEKIIEEGELILKYQKQEDEKYARGFAFETEFKIFISWMGKI